MNNSVFVVRHSEWKWENDGVTMSLTEKGIELAMKTALDIREATKNVRNVTVVTSLIQRASLTAKIISNICDDAKIITSELLTDDCFFSKKRIETEDFLIRLLAMRNKNESIIIVTHEPWCKFICRLMKCYSRIEMGMFIGFPYGQ